MATTYFWAKPPRDPNGDPLRDSRLPYDDQVSPLVSEMQRSAAEFWDKNRGSAEDRAVNAAVDRFRNNLSPAWDDYRRLQGQDAVEGYFDFSQANDAARIKALAGLTGVVLDRAKPVLTTCTW